MIACNETQRTFMLKVDIELSAVSVAVMPLNLVKQKKRHFSQELWETELNNTKREQLANFNIKKESSAEYSSEIYLLKEY